MAGVRGRGGVVKLHLPGTCRHPALGWRTAGSFSEVSQTFAYTTNSNLTKNMELMFMLFIQASLPQKIAVTPESEFSTVLVEGIN